MKDRNRDIFEQYECFNSVDGNEVDTRSELETTHSHVVIHVFAVSLNGGQKCEKGLITYITIQDA